MGSPNEFLKHCLRARCRKYRFHFAAIPGSSFLGFWFCSSGSIIEEQKRNRRIRNPCDLHLHSGRHCSPLRLELYNGSCNVFICSHNSDYAYRWLQVFGKILGAWSHNTFLFHDAGAQQPGVVLNGHTKRFHKKKRVRTVPCISILYS